MSRRIFISSAQRFRYFPPSFCFQQTKRHLSQISISRTSFSASRTSFPENLCFSSPTGFIARALNSFAIRSMPISASQSSATALIFSDNKEEVELLTGREDDYDGVIVDMVAPMDAAAFVSSLRASICKWRQQGKKGVWIKLPIQLVNLVQPAVEEGFYYHHAEPNYLMLVHWISDTVSTIPVNATHRVGIGAFVLNNKREVLAIKEKSGKLRGTDVWKFPTGVIDVGEDIVAGAIREVKEETGIDTEFVEVLGFRQSHKVFFGKSDLFFICMLRPLSFEIQKQEMEIEDAKWMPFEEYAKQDFVQKHELLRKITEICSAKTGYSGFSPVPTDIGSDHFCYLYLNRRDMEQQPTSGNQA